MTSMMRRMLGVCLLVFILIAVGVSAQDQMKDKDMKAKGVMTTKQYNVMGESVGLSGYDPVAYFPEGGSRPQKGLISISYQYDGVTYRFARQENLDRFKANPSKFLPAYGGWCAWAVGELGKRVDVDPENFEVRDGQLFVFYRDPRLDTRALWLKDPKALKAKADANWPALAK